MSEIRVLVVDDSAVIRRIVTSVLGDDPDVTVVGTAGNGQIAIDKVRELNPDLITMDVEMPQMDGLEAVRRLRGSGNRTPIIMFSTLTERGASATLDALAAGASDYVTKPSNVGSFEQAKAAVREQLIPKAKALTGKGRRSPVTHPLGKPPAPSGRAPEPRTTGTRPAASPVRPERATPLGTASKAAAPIQRRTPIGAPAVLVIGCSTGGPDALEVVLRGLPADFPLPVAIVQHMPPVFTKMFAQRLDRTCALSVTEAFDGQVVAPGQAVLAPGDFHMEIARSGKDFEVSLNQRPHENFCRPAVDVLFRSAAAEYGGNVLALILTGMGHDGRDGCIPLAAAGARILAQDEATSVVWGMPGAVAHAGLAHAVLPLELISRNILDYAGSGARPGRPNASVGGS